MERDGHSSRQNPNSARGGERDHLLGDHDRGDCPRHPRRHSRIEEGHKEFDSNYSQSGDCPRHPRRHSLIDERSSSLSSRNGDRVAKHSIYTQRNCSRIDECPSNLSNSSRDRFDPKWSEVTYRCGHTARLHLDTRDSYHENWNRFGLSLKFGQRPSEASRSHLYNTNTLSADYVNVGYSFTEFSARLSGSSSKASNGPQLDSKRKANPGRRYSLNFSDFCSEMAFRRNDGRASSWSLSNLNATSSHTPRGEAQPGIHRPYAIKIPSADNIRQLQKDWNMPKDKLKPSTSNAHLLEDLNNAICCQPRESKNKFSVQNLDPKRDSNSASSVVHWTNSVENRVCCPETVLYGAVYGLKCLK